MVRKIKQWVPIDGTRWRNEAANSHERHEVGIHDGVAHRVVMAPLRELPNTAGLGGLLGPRLGSPLIYLLVKTRVAVENSLLRNP